MSLTPTERKALGDIIDSIPVAPYYVPPYPEQLPAKMVISEPETIYSKLMGIFGVHHA